MEFYFSSVKQFTSRGLVPKTMQDLLYPFPLHPLMCCPGHVVQSESPARRGEDRKQRASHFLCSKRHRSCPHHYWQTLTHTATTGHKGVGKGTHWLGSYVPNQNAEVLSLKEGRERMLGNHYSLSPPPCPDGVKH